jgi:hypothetical protein
VSAQAVAHATDMLAHQNRVELLEPCRRVVERPDDRLALGDRQRQNAHDTAVGVLEARCEGWVIHEPRELEDKLIADRDAGEEHASIMQERMFVFKTSEDGTFGPRDGRRRSKRGP